jgi:hypothetical protein
MVIEEKNQILVNLIAKFIKKTAQITPFNAK